MAISFDSAASSTYKKGGEGHFLQYGRGSVLVNAGVDTVRLGGNAVGSLTISNVNFGQATCLDTTMAEAKISGILGLSAGRATIGDKKTVFDYLVEQKLIDQPVFTVWLEKKGSGTHEQAGVYTFGGVDSTHCGPVIEYLPVKPTVQFNDAKEYTFWKFEEDSIAFGNLRVPQKRFTSQGRRKFPGEFRNVISDTGTSLIGGPEVFVDYMAKSVGAIGPDVNGNYIIDCNAKFEPLIITIGGKDYPLGPEQLVIGSWPLCSFGMSVAVATEPDVEWILGEPWARAYCQVHDVGQKQIGFAMASP
ncbi:Protein ASP-2 b [Aphelenchoides avenae]|nr:Protein ASP-2 b [Aphelenchus avenae]